MSLSLAQRDAYRRHLRTEVERCDAMSGGFAIRLRETVLHATGGGQPADHGTIAGVDVEHVVRDQDGAIVHRTARPVALGEVEVVVDWARRYDLMQQHSAQHLITALADDEFALPTISFHLGDGYCAIEFGCEMPPTEQTLESLATRVNDEIRARRDIRWRTVPVDDYAALPGVRSRGLPDGHRGDVRLVEIDGLDLNTCGGTHVANTAELQVVRFGRMEKTTGGARLHYFAGGRVLGQLCEWGERDAELGQLLTCPPSEFARSVAALQEQVKAAARSHRALSTELARRVAADIKRSADDVVALVLEDDDPAFFNAIANDVGDEKLVVLVGDGVFLVSGADSAVEAMGPRVRDALGGRGGGRGGRFQGKFAPGVDVAAVLAGLCDQPAG